MTSHSPASSPELPKLPKLPAAREFYGHDYVGDKIHAGMGFIDEDMEAYATAHGLACYEAGSAAAAQAAWRPIAGAPKDGTEVLLWREDCGQFIGSYVSADSFPLEQKEIDELTEEELFTHDWFTQWPDARRLEGSELPTLWQHLPAAPSATSVSEPQTKAARDVLAERQRQVSAEGWTPEHDDEHWEGDLSLAGAVYAVTKGPRTDVPPAWPWEADAFKPRDWRRNLIKAGALILAEIERLDRKASRDCVDPMCACRGGPCAECPEGQALAAAPASPQAPACLMCKDNGVIGGWVGGPGGGYDSEDCPECSVPAAPAQALNNLHSTLKQALRIPGLPFPDPHAHSLDAYARAVHSAYCQLRFKIMDSIKLVESAMTVPAAPSAAPHQGAEPMAQWTPEQVADVAAKGAELRERFKPARFAAPTHQGADALREAANNALAVFKTICSYCDSSDIGPTVAEEIESACDDLRAALAQHQAPQQGEPK